MVAVNSFAFFAHESNTVDALLGTECVMVSQSPDGDYIQQAGRNRDGIWWGPSGPRKQGLGAVFSTEQVDPWNFAARKGRLIRNPWAAMPLPAFELGVDEYWPEDGHFQITDGAKFWTLLGLPEGWPEG